jgi:hypothetical protein
LKTESHFKAVRPQGAINLSGNRERLRSLLGEVMIRNTRSLVQMDLPSRYAQTILGEPQGDEARLYELLAEYLRSRKALPAAGNGDAEAWSDVPAADEPPSREHDTTEDRPPLSRRQLAALLTALPPAALGQSLDHAARPGGPAIIELAGRIDRSERPAALTWYGKATVTSCCLRHVPPHPGAFAANAGERRTRVLTFSGAESDLEKDAAVAVFRDSAGSCCAANQAARAQPAIRQHVVNFDLPWNPRIEKAWGASTASASCARCLHLQPLHEGSFRPARRVDSGRPGRVCASEGAR